MSDYQDDDFTTKGYYLVTYGGRPKPAGPYDSPKELAQAHQLTDYPDNGYVVHFTGDTLANVPSLNPDDLYPGPGNRIIMRCVDCGAAATVDEDGELSCRNAADASHEKSLQELFGPTPLVRFVEE